MYVCICSGRKNIPVKSVFTSHFCSNGGTVRSWTLASGKPLDSWEAFLLTVECDELPVAKQIGFRSWVVFIATDETTVLYSRLIDCFLFYLKILYLYCKKPVSHVAQEKILFPSRKQIILPECGQEQNWWWQKRDEKSWRPRIYFCISGTIFFLF